jgi:hypothetical protein
MNSFALVVYLDELVCLLLVEAAKNLLRVVKLGLIVQGGSGGSLLARIYGSEYGSLVENHVVVMLVLNALSSV